MIPDRWRDLLGTWSREMLAIEEYARRFPPAVVAAGWLGYPPATLAEIAITEARLGRLLPPSYRAFLKVTNGWPATTTVVGPIRPVGEIAWYRDAYPTQLAAWQESEGDAPWPTGRGLQHTLAVSDEGRAAYLLLPRRIRQDGEWPAWLFTPSFPLAREYPSFWRLMLEEHASFLRLAHDRREHE